MHRHQHQLPATVPHCPSRRCFRSLSLSYCKHQQTTTTGATSFRPGFGHPATILTTQQRYHHLFYKPSIRATYHFVSSPPCEPAGYRAPWLTVACSSRGSLGIASDCATRRTMSTITPVKQASAPITSVTDSPGTWRHPRLNEITRRRNATTFSDKNVRQMAFSVGGIIFIWLLQALTKLKFFQNAYANSKLYITSVPRGLKQLTLFGSVPSPFRTYLDWGCLVLQLAPLLNIVAACMPLLRKEDDLSDIPLTAEQRKLLGLAPSSAAPTPDAKYSTPPRYSRTPSIAGSIGSNRSYTSSPLSGKGSPLVHGSGGGSGSYSPLGSPLFKRGLDASTNGRRSSISNGSPFATSTSTNLFAEPPASPSPAGGKRTSVGLNSKWLYERGRRSSGSAFLH